ncbi:cell division control protein 42 homolog isoform X1 [Ischnura elegans]|uniref:cell division control protein 42 homolog isoform X1 n=1 Tax=Ischnura elegans TaxID=197161 RepID=UPI001ED88644|nr:cell division control protein 42 homolog isoform X1 [Ischnura elegans]
MRDESSIKCVVVGDGTVGKTCLLISYTEKKFPTEYVPTIFDNYTADISIDGKAYKIGLFDTAGQDEYDSLRPLSYPGSDVFLLCFSIDNPMSLENVKYKWVPELKSHSPEVVPIILIGNKIDLRGKSRRTVATQTGQRVAKELGLEAYSECSALTQVGVKNVFDLAITAALKHRAPRKRKNKCILL